MVDVNKKNQTRHSLPNYAFLHEILSIKRFFFRFVITDKEYANIFFNPAHSSSILYDNVSMVWTGNTVIYVKSYIVLMLKQFFLSEEL